MVDQKSQEAPLEVWTDGGCRLCQRSRAWCELRDRGGRFRFIDFRASDESELPMSISDHQASMWIRDRNGSLLEGFDAWCAIMAEIPGWRWVARLASMPPLASIGPPLYRWVAARRHRLAAR